MPVCVSINHFTKESLVNLAASCGPSCDGCRSIIHTEAACVVGRCCHCHSGRQLMPCGQGLFSLFQRLSYGGAAAPRIVYMGINRQTSSAGSGAAAMVSTCCEHLWLVGSLSGCQVVFACRQICSVNVTCCCQLVHAMHDHYLGYVCLAAWCLHGPTREGNMADMHDASCTTPGPKCTLRCSSTGSRLMLGFVSRGHWQFCLSKCLVGSVTGGGGEVVVH